MWLLVWLWLLINYLRLGNLRVLPRLLWDLWDLKRILTILLCRRVNMDGTLGLLFSEDRVTLLFLKVAWSICVKKWLVMRPKLCRLLFRFRVRIELIRLDIVLGVLLCRWYLLKKLLLLIVRCLRVLVCMDGLDVRLIRVCDRLITWELIHGGRIILIGLVLSMRILMLMIALHALVLNGWAMISRLVWLISRLICMI